MTDKEFREQSLEYAKKYNERFGYMPYYEDYDCGREEYIMALMRSLITGEPIKGV